MSRRYAAWDEVLARLAVLVLALALMSACSSDAWERAIIETAIQDGVPKLVDLID